MTEITIHNVRRAVTAKVCKQGLCFFYFTCCLMMFNISVKSDENISHSF